MDLGDDIDAVHFELGGSWEAQRGVENGAVLGGVDVLAGKHGGDLVGKFGLDGEVLEEGQCLGGDVLAGEVEKDAVVMGAEGVGPGGVLKEIAEVELPGGLGVGFEGVPGGEVGEAHGGFSERVGCRVCV